MNQPSISDENRAEGLPQAVRILGFDYVTGTKTSKAQLLILALIDRAMLALFGREAPAPVPSLTGKVIAISKIDLLGDVLMITPVLRELRLQVPTATLLLIVASWSQEAGRLALDEKLCDHLIIYDPPTMSPMRISWRRKIKQWLRTVRQARSELRRLKTDVFLELRSNSPNSLLLARLARVPHKVGFALRGFSYILQQVVPYDGTMPMGQQYLDALEVLGLQSKPYEKPILTWRGEPGPAPAWAGSGPTVLVLHPFSRNARKMISGAWWEKMARLLAPGRKIVVLGTRGDLENRELVAALRAAGCDLSAVGQTTFRQAMACIREASAFVGVDSVFAHVALAYDKPAYVAATKGASYRPAFPASSPHLFYDEVRDGATGPDESSPPFQQYTARIKLSQP